MDIGIALTPRIAGIQFAHDCAVDADYLSAPANDSAYMHAPKLACYLSARGHLAIYPCSRPFSLSNQQHESHAAEV